MQQRRPPAPASSTISTTSSSASGRGSAAQKRKGRRRKAKANTTSRITRAWAVVIALVIVPVVIVTFGAGLAVGVIITNFFKDTSKNNESSSHLFLRRGSGNFDERSSTTSNNIFPPHYPVVSVEATTTALGEDILEMCANTLWHTLRTTTIVLPKDETFVHTGDIDDQWGRDSAGQVHPLLLPWFPGGALVAQDARLARVVSGLIRRSAFYIRHDPYANAFRIDTSYVFNEEQRRMGRHDYISTWNYELDSGCYFIRMLYFYWKALPDAPILLEKLVYEAVSIIIDTMIAEQHHEDNVYPKGDLFDCQNCKGPYRYRGLQRDGKGRPTKYTGMTWTGFRPSDDECLYGYLVPANMFAVVALGYAAELAQALWAKYGGYGLASKAMKLADEIDDGIRKYGVVEHETFGKMYAYEVDGLGNSLLMDDANVPSLLSAPYLGYKYDNDAYANTKRFIFSKSNPTYQSGTNPITGQIDGYGSQHMRSAIWQNIWPMSMAMRGLTSDVVEEKLQIIEQLHKASAGTSWMHESFDVNNPKKFTRPWFCWADALFAELVMSVTDQCPGAKEKYTVRWWKDPELPEGGMYAGDQSISMG